jgi:hypothetical protein
MDEAHRLITIEFRLVAGAPGEDRFGPTQEIGEVGIGGVLASYGLVAERLVGVAHDAPSSRSRASSAFASVTSVNVITTPSTPPSWVR